MYMNIFAALGRLQSVKMNFFIEMLANFAPWRRTREMFKMASSLFYLEKIVRL